MTQNRLSWLKKCVFFSRRLNEWTLSTDLMMVAKIGSPNLTQKCSTTSPGNPFLLGSKDQYYSLSHKSHKNNASVDLCTILGLTGLPVQSNIPAALPSVMGHFRCCLSYLEHCLGIRPVVDWVECNDRLGCFVDRLYRLVDDFTARLDRSTTRSTRHVTSLPVFRVRLKTRRVLVPGLWSACTVTPVILDIYRSFTHCTAFQKTKKVWCRTIWNSTYPHTLLMNWSHCCDSSTHRINQSSTIMTIRDQ